MYFSPLSPVIWPTSLAGRRTTTIVTTGYATRLRGCGYTRSDRAVSAGCLLRVTFSPLIHLLYYRLRYPQTHRGRPTVGATYRCYRAD